MHNTLLKSRADIVTAGRVVTPGSAGTPYQPGYYKLVTSIEATDNSTYVYDEDGNLQVIQDLSYAPVTRRVWVPPVPATPPTPAVVIPDSVETVLNLGWTGAARSVGEIAGDGAAQFRIDSLALGVVIGFNGRDEGAGYADIDHAIHAAGGLFAIIEGGTIKTAYQAFSTGDVFTLLRSGTAVHTFKGADLIYSSETPSYSAAFLDASLYCGDDAVYDASIGGGVPAGIQNSGSGTATLSPLGALGSDEEYSGGAAMLSPLQAQGEGNQETGGTAVLAPLGAIGSDYAYSGGTATLPPLQASGSSGAELAAGLNVGYASLPAITAIGYGAPEMPGVYDPATSLGDASMHWPPSTLQGNTLTIVSGAGAGQVCMLVDNNFQVLLIASGTPWTILPDETSRYAITDPLGNVLFTGYSGARGNQLPQLGALGSDYAYAGGAAVLPALGASGGQTQRVDGYLFATMPSPKLVFTARAIAPNQIVASMPAPVVEIFGGGTISAAMPSPVVEMLGTATPIARIAASMPTPVVEFSALAGAVGGISATMSGFELEAFGGGVLEVVLQDGFLLEFAGLAGAVGQITATMPLFELEFSAQSENFGQIIAVMPMLQPVATGFIEAVMPMARVEFAGHAVVAMECEAYAVNLLTGGTPDSPTGGEVTRYTNFPFDWVVRHHDKYYGVSRTGLFLLGGDTDIDAPIPWAFRTGITDFGTMQKKTLVSAYLGGEVAPGATITTLAGDKSEISYSYPVPASAGGETARARFGRGLQARYFAVEMSDAAGGSMAIDAIDLEIQKLKRAL